MPPQIRSAFNWSLFVQVVSVLLSMGLGAVLVVQEQKLQIALDHQDIANLHSEIKKVSDAVDSIRNRVPDSGTYDAKFSAEAQRLDSLRDDLKVLNLQWQRDHNQLLAKRLVQP